MRALYATLRGELCARLLRELLLAAGTCSRPGQDGSELSDRQAELLSGSLLTSRD